ncbi:hypothetical protein ACHAXR_007237 [Thalassiosira sp. AJA248-18]
MAATMSDNTTRKSNKRRRESLLSAGIFDIPDEALISVTHYLPKTSRALLALALTTDSSSWRDINWDNTASILSWVKKAKKKPSAATKAIVAAELWLWEDLDFVDIEKSLAKKLTDDDIGGVLSCVNSFKKLRSLKLTGCVNITGRGLEPLRGSVVLERLDLSLRKQHECPDIEPNSHGFHSIAKAKSPPLILSETAVVPILESINSLKYLHLPKEWRERQSGMVIQFIQMYHNSESQRVTCGKCESTCQDLRTEYWGYPKEEIFGIQNFTCYICLAHCCYSCIKEHERCPGVSYLGFCSGCEKDYCFSCSSMTWCEECDMKSFCAECAKKRKCADCERVLCESETCNNCWLKCGGCKAVRCSACMTSYTCAECYKEYECCNVCDEREDKDLKFCEVCSTDHCFDCRLKVCRDDWKGACRGCIRLLGPN